MRSLTLTAVSLVLLAIASLVLVSGCGRSFADRVISVGPTELTVAKGSEETPETHEVAPDAEIILDGQPAELTDIRPGDFVKVTTEKQGPNEQAVKVVATRSEEEDATDQPSSSHGLPSSGLLEQPTEPATEPLPGETEPKEAEPGPEDMTGFGEADSAPNEDDQGTSLNQEEDNGVIFTGLILLVRDDQVQVQGDVELEKRATVMSFKLTEETQVIVAGEPAAKEDLIENTKVTVTAERDGDELVATRIDAEPILASS